MKKLPLLFATAALALIAAPAFAQLVVSTTDGKQLRPDDDVPGVTPDEVSIIDLNRYPPKVLGTVAAPASLSGPAGSIAVARDESFAIFTSPQRINPDDPTKLIADDIVTVLDMRKPAAPVVAQTTHAGLGATGVALNSAGTMALVTSLDDDAVTVFGVANRALTRLTQVKFPAGSDPSAVAFTPDGKQAVVSRRGDNKVSLLEVQGQTVVYEGIDIAPGRTPYGLWISPDGAFAYVPLLGGLATPEQLAAPPVAGAPRAPGAVVAVDLVKRQVVGGVEVGTVPEASALSPDGKMLAVVVANGASVQKRAPTYGSTYGLLKLFAVNGGSVTPLDEVHNGHWCQGVTFSKDLKTLLVQCAAERNIEVYRIEGGKLRRDDAATLPTRSRGAALATAAGH